MRVKSTSRFKKFVKNLDKHLSIDYLLVMQCEKIYFSISIFFLIVSRSNNLKIYDDLDFRYCLHLKKEMIMVMEIKNRRKITSSSECNITTVITDFINIVLSCYWKYFTFDRFLSCKRINRT